MIVWAASHAVGIGFLIDIAMVVVIGVAVLKAFEVMWDIHKIISGASNKADLDRAAKMLAGVIISLGIGTFLAIVTRGAAKSRFRPPPDKSSGSAKHEVEFIPARKRGGGETKPVVVPPKMIKEKHGSNEAVWTVDKDGMPISVEAKLDSTYKTPRSSSEKTLQQGAGANSRLADDDGGHLIGHRFMSDQGEKNLFPQNANLNRSGYKKMENEWADWTDEGFEVRLKVELHPPGAERPTDIFSSYEVFDPKTNKRVFEREHQFTNQAGEAFERVAKSDMKGYN